MLGQDGVFRRRPQCGPIVLVAPRPGVSEPELREDVDGRRFWASVADRNLQQNVLRRRLCVLDEHIEVPVLIEDARVDQLAFGILSGANAVLLDQLSIGKCSLRVLVEHLQVRMRRCRIKVVIEFLDVFAMIGLAVGEAEETFLENRVLAVPERDRQTQALLIVAQARDPILAPAICATTRMIVAEVLPRVAAARIVFTHRSPLTFAEIRPPAAPGPVRAPSVFQPTRFLVHASSFTAPSACATQVRTKPRVLDSASSPSSASIRTWPPSSFVLHVPHCPCRQNDGIATPCSSAACNNVWPLRTVHVLPDRTNSTATPVSGAADSDRALVGGALPKLSCLIRSGFTPKPVRLARLSSMNGGGPHRKKSEAVTSVTACSLNARLTCPRGPD